MSFASVKQILSYEEVLCNKVLKWFKGKSLMLLLFLILKTMELWLILNQFQPFNGYKIELCMIKLLGDI